MACSVSVLLCLETIFSRRVQGPLRFRCRRVPRVAQGEGGMVHRLRYGYQMKNVGGGCIIFFENSGSSEAKMVLIVHFIVGRW